MLRGCAKNIKYSNETIKKIVERFDAAVMQNTKEIRNEEKGMISKILKKFDTVVKLDGLKSYSLFFGN